jgi:hypothetical protein
MTKTKYAKTVEELDTANTIVLSSATLLPISSVAFVVVRGIWRVIALSDAIPIWSSRSLPLHLTDHRGRPALKDSTRNMPVSWQSLAKGPQVAAVMIPPNHPGAPVPQVFRRLLVRIFLLGVDPKCGSLPDLAAVGRPGQLRAGTALLNQAMEARMVEAPVAMVAHPKDMDRGHILAIKHHTDSNHRDRIIQARMHNTINNSMRSNNPPNEISEATSTFMLTTLTDYTL